MAQLVHHFDQSSTFQTLAQQLNSPVMGHQKKIPSEPYQVAHLARTPSTPSEGTMFSRTSYSSEASTAEACAASVKESAVAATDHPEHTTWTSKLRQRLTKWLSLSRSPAAPKHDDEDTGAKLDSKRSIDDHFLDQAPTPASSEHGVPRREHAGAPRLTTQSSGACMQSPPSGSHQERFSPSRLVKFSSDRARHGVFCEASLPSIRPSSSRDAASPEVPESRHAHATTPPRARACMGPRLQNSRSMKFLMQGSLSMRPPLKPDQQDLSSGDSCSAKSDVFLPSLRNLRQQLHSERVRGCASSSNLGKALSVPHPPSAHPPPSPPSSRARDSSSSGTPSQTPPGGCSPLRRRGSLCAGNTAPADRRLLYAPQLAPFLLSQPSSPTIHRTGSVAGTSLCDQALLPPLPHSRKSLAATAVQLSAGPGSCPVLPASRQSSYSSPGVSALLPTMLLNVPDSPDAVACINEDPAAVAEDVLGSLALMGGKGIVLTGPSIVTPVL